MNQLTALTRLKVQTPKLTLRCSSWAKCRHTLEQTQKKLTTLVPNTIRTPWASPILARHHPTNKNPSIPKITPIMTLARCRVRVLYTMARMESAVRRPRIAIMQIRRASTALSEVFRLYEFQLNTHSPRNPGQLRLFRVLPPVAGCGRGGNEVGNDGSGALGAFGGTSASIVVCWFGCDLNILTFVGMMLPQCAIAGHMLL